MSKRAAVLAIVCEFSPGGITPSEIAAKLEISTSEAGNLLRELDARVELVPYAARLQYRITEWGWASLSIREASGGS